MSAYIGTKAARKWTGQIGSGGVADASVATIPIQSATGLTNGAVYVFTVDRVDSNGVKTASKEEVVKGTLSGTNFVSCTRGVAGTAQAHSAGAVVEILMEAVIWNELIEGLEAEHGTDGTHDNTKVGMLAGTQTFTGEKTFTTPVTVNGTSSSAGEVRLREDTDNGTNYISLKAPATLSGDKTFILPNADGTTGQFLKTDGSGNLSFATPSSGGATHLARAYQSVQQTNLTSGSWVKINLQTENYDTGNNFDSTTNYRYTAPSTGYYQVNAVLSFGVTVANKYLGVAIRRDGSTFLAYSWVQTDNSGQISAHLSDIVYMTAGQYIEMMGQVVGDSTFDVLADTIATYMSVAYLGTGA